MKKITTSRFGEIEAAEDAIIHFGTGIPAFEEEREFLIIPYEEGSPYVFLQSVKTPELAFLMTMPLIFFPDYEFTIDLARGRADLCHPHARRKGDPGSHGESDGPDCDQCEDAQGETDRT